LLSATELETWGLLHAVQSLSPGIFFERFVTTIVRDVATTGRMVI
jgi:hypothetical protein